jgi:hypothetical protein
MPARIDPATDLADKMIQVLEAQRRLGAAAYPLSLRRLAQLADPAAAPDIILKAGAKKKPFGDRAVVARNKSLDAPVALIEDIELLAASPLLLEFVLDLVCTPAKPTVDPGSLKSKVVPRLQQPFQLAVQTAMREETLPASVAVVQVKAKRLLHLKRYPLPRAPAVVLAENLLQALHAQRSVGEEAYPPRLAQLVATAQPGTPAALVKKALALPLWKDAVIAGFPSRADSPIALKEDIGALAASPRLLETAFQLVRHDRHQAIGVNEMKTKVNTPLRTAFIEAVERRLATSSLPASFGCLWQKKKRLLFLVSDLPTPPVPVPTEPPADFARRFDEAFGELERRARMPNFVSLVDLRRALPCEREQFDAELRQLRLTGRYTLSAAEGRYGIQPDEQAAGIREDGALLLYVSRKLP